MTPHLTNHMDTPPPFIDLKNLNENQRCRLIADTCGNNKGKRVGFIVDNEEKVIARYIRKIRERNPLVNVDRIGEFTEGFFLRASQPTQGAN